MANDASVSCRDAIGGGSFRVVKPQAPHVERQWDNGTTTVWLERLEVK